jgi:uncharacterized protein (TIGR03437 family)
LRVKASSIVALACLTIGANAQRATLSYIDSHPCCIAPDGHGNNFVVGYGDPPASSISVVKVDSTGSVVSTFSVTVGANDNPAAAAVDPQGNLWIACSPVHGSGSVTPMRALVMKLDSSGTAVISRNTFGGPGAAGETGANAMAFDPAGNLYLAGYTDQPDFPATSGALMTKIAAVSQPSGVTISSAPQFAFLARFTPDFQLTYATLLGGQILQLPPCAAGCFATGAITIASALAVDSAGVATVAGVTNAGDFPVTKGSFQTECHCGLATANGFVTRVNAQGSGLVWSTFLGGSVQSSGWPMTLSGMAVDTGGNIVVTGTTLSSDFPVTRGIVQSDLARPPATTGAASSPANGFVSKLDATGSSLVFSTYYGLPLHMSPPVLDPQGNVWVTGTAAHKAALTLAPDSLVLGESFVAELAPDATRVLFSELLPNGVAGQNLGLNPDGSLTTTGNITAAQSLKGALLKLPSRAPGGVSILGVADSAVNSVSGAVAPGEYVSFYGTGLGADAQVSFDGIPATVLYSADQQVNALVPYEIDGHPQTSVRIVTGAGASPNVVFQVVPAHPNVFFVLNADGSKNGPGNPAEPGSTVSLLVSGAGAIVDGVPAAPVTTQIRYSYFIPFSPQLVEQTFTPLSVGSDPAGPVNLLRVDIQLPAAFPSLAEYFRAAVRVGGSVSPDFPLYMAGFNN